MKPIQSGNRQVHGYTASGDQIVRYDRSGKWYIEPTEKRRRLVTVVAAAHAAYLGNAIFGRPGGSHFDAKVRREQEWRESNG